MIINISPVLSFPGYIIGLYAIQVGVIVGDKGIDNIVESSELIAEHIEILGKLLKIVVERVKLLALSKNSV